MLAFATLTASVIVEAVRTERLVEIDFSDSALHTFLDGDDSLAAGLDGSSAEDIAEPQRMVSNAGFDAQRTDHSSALAEESQQALGSPAPHDDPEVVKKALRIAWAETQTRCEGGGKFPDAQVAEHLYKPFTFGSGFLGKYSCKVNILPSVNYLPGRLCVVREAWRQQFPDGFISAGSVEKQADNLISQFKKLAKVTEGTKSGSSIYVSDTKQLFLKSETERERKVFIKKDRRGHYFVEDYAARVTGNDKRFKDMHSPNLAKALGKTDDKRQCERSTLQRFLLVFTVACKGWRSWYEPTVWTLFAHVSPLPQVPKPLHQFDLKASRDQHDCHNDGKKGKFTGEIGTKEQGYLGDFMSLYKTPIASAECDRDRLTFGMSDESNRRSCLIKAIHKDLKLLGRYILVDYSFLVSTHKYDPAEDDQYLEKYNNLLKVRVQDTELVLTIGLIDLLRDYDVDTGLQFQSNIGRNKDLSKSHHVYGQDKFEDYSYYLFCLAAEFADPQCESARSLELLSQCDANTVRRARKWYPQPDQTRSPALNRWMTKYQQFDDYCELLASCQALNDDSVTRTNFDTCQDAACKALGVDTCIAEDDDEQGTREVAQKMADVWERLGLSTWSP